MLTKTRQLLSCALVFAAAFAAFDVSAQAAETPVDGAMLSSPDGRWHVYERRYEKGVQIWMHDMNGEKNQALVSLPGDNRNMAWSPDSLFVAFCATFHSRHFITVTDLTGHSWLVAEINGECNTPVWSPDASQLAFVSKTRTGDTDVYVATAGGTLHQNLTRTRDKNETVRQWLAGSAQPEIRAWAVE